MLAIFGVMYLARNLLNFYVPMPETGSEGESKVYMLHNMVSLFILFSAVARIYGNGK